MENAMISSTVARSYSGSPWLELALVRAKALRRLLRQWQERSTGRQELMRLTDSDLRDIGVSRSEAEAEAAKPFWQA
jgi:uncharacterized protein YjiS (DUF1127 family)